MRLVYKKRKPVLQLAGFELGLDCFAGEKSVVTHAHSDHSSFASRPSEILASQTTRELIVARGGRAPAPAIDSLSLDSVHAELFEAGHVLGSKQLYAEADGASFVYTGDFNPVESLTTPSAGVRECDTLFMECTYGRQEYSFPDRFAIYEDLSGWVKQNQSEGAITVFGAYTLGKTQELVACLNEYAGIAPVVTPAAKRFSDVYERNNIKQDCIDNSSVEAASELKGAFTAIVPSNKATVQLAAVLQEHYCRPVRIAQATGWANNSSLAGAHRAFALSDHADFNGLMDYALSTNAKTVYCTHGFSAEFAQSLRSKGINAVDCAALREGQRTLIMD
ncbi:hypothetical protein AUJ14_03410 [Candidatus Micrarchaeota archaeon CG1_02_55_22]|nr:MAG: hypothetical protein AUJ14_03410 [Candidatus Micrarchaeota archaeon CG1_02_55_22]